MGGPKSRGNFKLGICMKFDCKNRDKKCKECIRFSRYRGDKKNELARFD